MIERAIENWLTRTNERNYKIPFCQALAREGHTLVFISADRPMEQGKDIITIAPDGIPYAYQLKGGDIGLGRWRTEVRPEIEELIQLPIVHPNIDKKKLHKSFLVLNGGISDEVRIQIDQINEDNVRRNRGYSHLEVIGLQQLLKTLKDAQGKFVPHRLSDFKSFLELFLASGKGLLDKAKFFAFLNGALFSEVPKQKADALNAISSSVILTAYAMAEFAQEKNHFALFEAWTALGVSIVRFAERAKLAPKEWERSLELVLLEIRRVLEAIEDEALLSKEAWIQGAALGDGGDTLRARTTLVLGALAVRGMDRYEADGAGIIDRNILDLIHSRQRQLWLWGESAFPAFFAIAKFLEAAGETGPALDILKTCLEGVLVRNDLRSDNALPSPYYSAVEVLKKNLGLVREPDGQENAGSSFILKPLISALVRRNQRDFLAKNWRRISHMRFREFCVDSPEEWLLWHGDKGTNKSWYPTATQKWSELATQAAGEAGACPKLLSSHRALVRAFTLVAPHRINDPVVSFLDDPAETKNNG